MFSWPSDHSLMEFSVSKLEKKIKVREVVIVVVQSFSHILLFEIPRIAACQASLSFTISGSLFKLMSIESMMPSNPLNFFCPFSSCPQSFPASGSFSMSQLFEWVMEYNSVIRRGWNWVICRGMNRPRVSMAPHSSFPACKIPWTEEPGRLQSMGSWRVRHDWATSLSLFTFMHGRRKWQPTPVLLPGESRGPGSLVGCHLWGHTESDTTEVT